MAHRGCRSVLCAAHACADVSPGTRASPPSAFTHWQSSAERSTQSVRYHTSPRERCPSFRGRHASPSSSSLSLRSRRSTLAGLPRGFAPLDDCRFSAGCELPAGTVPQAHHFAVESHILWLRSVNVHRGAPLLLS